MLPDKQFFLDSGWRALRTFCQTLAGMLVVVQTSNVMPSTPDINIPWQAYLYASGIAALVSLLQSMDRERAVNSAITTTPVIPAVESRLSAAEAQLAVFGPGCGGDQK